jgi:Fe-S-cluster formation regulator IscX/YfhJ
MDAEHRGGVMNTSKLRDSTAIDKALAITATEKELEIKLEGNNNGEQVEFDKPAPTAEYAATFLRGISASSSSEIDALVTDLQNLREKLVDDGARVENNVIEFTTLNQSVMQLAKLISDSIAQVKVPKPVE